MRYCSKCGMTLEGMENYCTNCGLPLKGRRQPSEKNHISKDSSTSFHHPYVNNNTPKEKEATAQNEELSFMDEVKSELFMTVEENSDQFNIDRNNASILHVVSWICFILSLLTVFEMIASLIGYILARLAMNSGVNANAARWANLIVTVIYLLIFILFLALSSIELFK